MGSRRATRRWRILAAIEVLAIGVVAFCARRSELIGDVHLSDDADVDSPSSPVSS